MLSTRTAVRVVTLFLLFTAALFANAQAYTSIVVFGDSLSDTGNDATLSNSLYGLPAQVPGPFTGYTNCCFTDGPDTLPAAQMYTGVWIQQLAAKLAAKPAVLNSLAGGTDYAYGYAMTGSGTSQLTYGPNNTNIFSITVNNMGLQLSTYLATNPTITNKTLFVIWGGANDLLNATTSAAVTQAATNEIVIMQQLITAGATDFLVVNLPPLGLIPRLNGSATTSLPATQAAAAFNQALATGLAMVPAAYPGKTLHIFPLDVYTLFNTIVGPPLYKGFANVTASSQSKGVNPDTYLFWDDLHPTTYGHSLIAAAALTAIGTPVTTSTVLTSSNLTPNLNTSVTLTATVTAASGTPTGTVAFFDGALMVGSGLVYGSTNTATATYTPSTTLSAGIHTFSATFIGANGYASSTGAAINEIVTAPAFSASFASNTLTIPSGSSGTAYINLNAVGGYTGTVTLACGTLPAHFGCTVTPTSIAYPSTVTTASVTITTSNPTAQLTRPALGRPSALPITFAVLLFPGLGFIGLARRRKLLARAFPLLSALFLLAAAFAISGCSSNSNNAAPGNYTVPVIVTAGSSSSTLNLTVSVQ